MKYNILNTKRACWIAVLAVASLVSCRKYESLGYNPGTGAPTITSVHTWNQNDTAVTYDTVTYVLPNSDGTTRDSTALKQRPTQIQAFDSVVTDGNLSNYYIINGTNLGSATAVYFNGTNAYFNRALGSDQSIVVQVPSNTPYLKPKATDTLTIVTEHGTVKYYFPILPPPPTINKVSDYNFIANSTDTLYGVGFLAVNSVSVVGIASSPTSTGIKAPVSITYQSDTVIVVKFPQTSLTQGNLLFDYTVAATGVKDSAVSTTVFNDMDNNYQILGPTNTADPTQTWAAVFQNKGVSTGWVANGWSSWAASTSIVQGIAGISFYGKFDNGGWKVAGFQFNTGVAGSTPALAYDPSYQYLSFWVLNTGVAVAQTAYIQWGNNVFGQNQVNPITIQPGGWQFFKIPISSLTWNTGTTPWSANSSLPLMDVGFFLTCQSAGSNIGEADLYFTDVALIK